MGKNLKVALAFFIVITMLTTVLAGDFLIETGGSTIFTVDTNGGANATGWLYQEGYKISEQFVNLSGDIMTGDLQFASGASIEVVDGTINVTTGEINIGGSPVSIWLYNQTDGSGNYSSEFQSSFDKNISVYATEFLYNQSAVTDITTWLYNQSLSPTITQWLYNQTSSSEFYYNQSDVEDITKWLYNQTEAASATDLTNVAYLNNTFQPWTGIQNFTTDIYLSGANIASHSGTNATIEADGDFVIKI